MPGRELKQSEGDVIHLKEGAKLLGIHPVTFAEMARKGLILAIKIGRVWRFRPSRLLQWLDEQEKKGGQVGCTLRVRHRLKGVVTVR